MTITWIVVGIAVALALFNVVTYRMRSKQSRSRGDKPPGFGSHVFGTTTADRPLHVGRPIRILLGAVIGCGGAILAGVLLIILLADDVSKKESPAAGLLVVGSTILLALSFIYVGWRLVVLRSHQDRLVGPRAATGAAIIVAVLAGVTLLIGIAEAELFLGLQSILLLAIAYGLVKWAKQPG